MIATDLDTNRVRRMLWIAGSVDLLSNGNGDISQKMGRVLIAEKKATAIQDCEKVSPCA